MKKESARIYARAFLNVCGEDITQEMVRNFVQAASFLHDHRRVLFLLKVPLISDAVKKRGIQELATRFHLPGCIDELFDLLLQHRRASLFAKVLQAIVTEYNKRYQHEIVLVTSAIALTEPQKKVIMRFIEAQFSGTKEYRFKTDTSLIAGIKIMSNTLLWESSIDNYLRECTQAQIW